MKNETITIEVTFDEKNIPHMQLYSELCLEQTTVVLDRLSQLLKENNFRFPQYLSTPYPN